MAQPGSLYNKQPGLVGTDPAALVKASPVDIQDVHIGIEHGPSGTVYNRMALPWSGANYVERGGTWVKSGGRDGALDSMEGFEDITRRWDEFKSAQQQMQGRNPGTFENLVEQLRDVHGGAMARQS